MAKCEKREIKPEPPPALFVLTLSASEAMELRAFLHDGKWPNWTERGGATLNNIHDALVNAGAPTK